MKYTKKIIKVGINSTLLNCLVMKSEKTVFIYLCFYFPFIRFWNSNFYCSFFTFSHFFHHSFIFLFSERFLDSRCKYGHCHVRGPISFLPVDWYQSSLVNLPFSWHQKHQAHNFYLFAKCSSVQLWLWTGVIFSSTRGQYYQAIPVLHQHKLDRNLILMFF